MTSRTEAFAKSLGSAEYERAVTALREYGLIDVVDPSVDATTVMVLDRRAGGRLCLVAWLDAHLGHGEVRFAEGARELLGEPACALLARAARPLNQGPSPTPS